MALRVRSWAGRAKVAATLAAAVGLAVATGAAWAMVPREAPPEATPEAPPAAPAGEAQAAPVEHDASEFLRVSEQEDGAVVTLELAIRELEPLDASRPRLWLVSAVHIGDGAYYQRLQEFLDTKELVLYEGVRPPGVGGDVASLSDDEKAKVTQKRLAFLGTLVERQKQMAGAYPASLEDFAREADARYAHLVRGAMVDAWGREIVMEAREPDAEGLWGFDLVSAGADGAEGGAGADADLRFSAGEMPPAARVKQMARGGGGGGGLQARLARALGLKFQLEEMRHDGPNWVNSDMSVDQMQERFAAAGADGDALFRMLDGTSIQARLAGLMLGFVERSPELRVMVKSMMVEVLSRGEALTRRTPGGMGAAMGVILHDRNEVVLADLARVLEREERPGTVGIIYGAGHMPDLQTRIEAMGYRAVGTEWVPAITVDLRNAPGGVEQARRMRETIRRSVDRQLGQE